MTGLVLVALFLAFVMVVFTHVQKLWANTKVARLAYAIFLVFGIVVIARGCGA